MQRSLVGIIMGSDSDLPIMKEAAEVLAEFHVSCECRIVSAHRTPDAMFLYAREAESRGIQVIIAGAGGAAHLPGMVASLTLLPVIGVPVRGKNMEGLDSLFSIVQMPAGVPVATVAINGARNAGILAIEIIALQDSELRERLRLFKIRLRESVEDKAAKLDELGFWKFLDHGPNE
ncbi:MAG TPA: 5-(carboxyamino)imidazole ribonucleotide mutase [Atribacteraceae bacterium]|nr:5-(carboxyamino)imidazole ribonucleotide mutase [Atribacteraceae bacterium]